MQFVEMDLAPSCMFMTSILVLEAEPLLWHCCHVLHPYLECKLYCTYRQEMASPPDLTSLQHVLVKSALLVTFTFSVVTFWHEHVCKQLT
mgnify:CR=1 FL=1